MGNVWDIMRRKLKKRKIIDISYQWFTNLNKIENLRILSWNMVLLITSLRHLISRQSRSITLINFISQLYTQLHTTVCKLLQPVNELSINKLLIFNEINDLLDNYHHFFALTNCLDNKYSYWGKKPSVPRSYKVKKNVDGEKVWNDQFDDLINECRETCWAWKARYLPCGFHRVQRPYLTGTRGGVGALDTITRSSRSLWPPEVIIRRRAIALKTSSRKDSFTSWKITSYLLPSMPFGWGI